MKKLPDFDKHAISKVYNLSDDDDIGDMGSDEIQSSEDTENTDDKLDDKVL